MTQDNATTDTLLTSFTTWLKGRGRSTHSLRAYRSDVGQFATWFREQTETPFALTAVTDQDVVNWVDHLSRVHHAMPATVNRKLAALSTFFRWAIEAKLVTSDPTANINGVEQQEVAPKALTEAAMNKILRKAKESGNLRDHALLELLAATGLRAAEAASLTLGDLSLDERSGWVTVRLGKGRRRCRVPIHLRTRKVFSVYLEQEQFGEPVTRAAHASKPLFRSRAGEPLTSYALWYTVKKSLARHRGR